MNKGTMLKCLAIVLLIATISLVAIITVVNNDIVIKFNPQANESPETTEAPTTTEAPVTNEAPTTTKTPVTIEVPVTTEFPETTKVPVTTQTLKIHQINVGCADAYLLQSDNFSIMIDGGESVNQQRVIKYLVNAGVSTLDYYIVSHWHGDHVQNMSAILRKFGDNDTIVYGPSTKCSSKYAIPSGKGKYKQLIDGDEISLDGITIKCMGPYKVSDNGNINYDSLNFLVKFGESEAFFTGDYVHKKVLENYKAELTNIDIYKMAHHGLKVSNYCGSPDVLPTLNPKIILVPANSSEGTQNLLSKFDISAKVYDNKSGNIVVVMDKSGEIIVTTLN